MAEAVIEAEREEILSPTRKLLTEFRKVKLCEWPFSTVVRGFANRKKFYAYMLSLLEKVEDERTETMAIRVENGRYVFCYHPEWYQYLVLPEVYTIVEHECLHIVLDHIPRFNRYIEMWLDDEIEYLKRTSVFNAGADLAVNTVIEFNKNNAIPFSMMLPQHFNLPRMDSMEFYIEELAKQVTVVEISIPNPQPGKGESSDGNDGGDGEHQGDRGESQEGGEGAGPGDGVAGSDDGGAGEGDGSEDADDGDEEKEAGGNSPSAPRPKNKQTKNNGSDQQAGGGNSPGSGAGDADGGQDGAAGEGGLGTTEKLEVTSPNEKLNRMMKEQHDWKIKPEEGESIRDLAGSLEQHAMELMETAVEHFSHMDGGKGRGLIPGMILQRIESKRTIHARRWEQILKEKITDSKKKTSEYRLNQLKPSRMALGSTLGLYGHDRDLLKFSILVGIDVSGSMSDEVIAYGLSIPQEILESDLDVEVKVIEYDTHPRRRYYLKRGQKPDPKILGRGGTDFNVFFAEAKSGRDPDTGKVFKPDLILNYTDGGAPMPDAKNRMSTRETPLLWVLSQGGYMDADQKGFGDVLRMDGRK